MIKSTQTSNTQDKNNCTVMALKSVTGWQERKCARILKEGGRKLNKGFDIEGYLADKKGKIEDVIFEPFHIKQDYSWENLTIKQFAERNPKGVFYIIVRGHALAIIDGVMVDNLVGRQAGVKRQVWKAYKVTGNINPNKGKIDETTKKRYVKLKFGEKVIYTGKPIKYQGTTLAKKGDRLFIQKQQGNGIVVVGFKTSDGYSLTGKFDRSQFKVTTERETAKFSTVLNTIK